MWDAQSFPTLSDPKDCSPPGSSVHGVLQARTLEWVAISCSRGSSQPRDQTQVSGTAGRLFTIWATREAHCLHQTSFLDGFSKTQGPFQSQRLCPPVSLPKMTFLYEWYILFSLDLNATTYLNQDHIFFFLIAIFYLCFLVVPRVDFSLDFYVCFEGHWWNYKAGHRVKNESTSFYLIFEICSLPLAPQRHKSNATSFLLY